MKYARLKDIRELVSRPENSKAISIFIPTHRISLPHNLRADRIRFKNAIQDIENKLLAEIDKKEVSRYIAQLRNILNSSNLWKYLDNGLAIYAQKDKHVIYDLPVEIESRTHIGDNYVISPLLATMQSDFSYFLLELNKEQPRFFVASQSGMTETLTDIMPGNIESTLRIDEYQIQLQHQSSPNGAHDASFHGHGGAKDQKRNDIIKYLRIIDSILWKSILHKSNRPLILAGDVNTLNMYKSASRYQYIFESFIEGNQQKTHPNQLHEFSWNIIMDHAEKEGSITESLKEKARFRDGKQLLVNESTISSAAKKGQVGTLFMYMLYKTYDNVVNRMERRLKVELPANLRQLKNIEQSARDVLASSGSIVSMIRNNNKEDHHSYIEALTR